MKSCSITVDVEEYFQVEAFSNNISRSDWGSYESRICFQTELLLETFEQNNVQATFFILGCVADKHPEIIRKIANHGHEIASHGYNHQHITKISQKDFISDITQSKSLLEDISAKRVIGYRAPCFSITPDNLWAHDEIKNAGYEYSSSTYPIIHDLYGVPLAPRTPYFLDNGLLEIPVSTAKIFTKTLPAAGGGFFRLFPYPLFKFLLNRAHSETGMINFYTHPWEYDPAQPKLSGTFKSNFRHHVNQKTALKKLKKLATQYHFETLSTVHMNKNYPKLGVWADIAKGQS